MWMSVTLFTFAFIFGQVCGGPKCSNCNGVPRQEDCDVITECSDSEACYTRKLTTSSGTTLYESGCISSQNCKLLQALTSPIGRKRALTNCYECCYGNSSSTDICNNHLCGAKDNSILKCYGCDDVLDPTDCRNVIECQADHMCYTQKYKRHENVDDYNRYKLGCQRKVVCDVIMNSDPTLTTGCNQCCNDDYCNIALCGLASLGPPTFVKKPDNFTVHQGSIVALRCEPDPKTHAYVSEWKFVSINGSTTIPSDVTIGGNKTFLLFTFDMNKYGVWSCVIKNANGMATANAYIGPVFHITTVPSTTPKPTTPKPTTTTPKPTTTTPKPTTTTPKPTTTTPKPTTTTPKPTTTTPKPTTTTPKPTTTTPKPTTTPFVCKDNNSRCTDFLYIATVCYDVDEGRLNCPKTCKFC